MAIDLARLRSIMRGEIAPKNGVTGVSGVTGVARYASKSPELRQLRPLRVKNTELEKDVFGGVTEGVSPPLRHPTRDPEAHRCDCGEVGVIGVGWFLRDPSRARWMCAECYRASQRKDDDASRIA